MFTSTKHLTLNAMSLLPFGPLPKCLPEHAGRMPSAPDRLLPKVLATQGPRGKLQTELPVMKSGLASGQFSSVLVARPQLICLDTRGLAGRDQQLSTAEPQLQATGLIARETRTQTPRQGVPLTAGKRTTANCTTTRAKVTSNKTFN